MSRIDQSRPFNEDEDESPPPLLQQPEASTSQRRSNAADVWSDEEKSKILLLLESSSDFCLGLFIRLVTQHGDDFKRIASSMPNKVKKIFGQLFLTYIA